MLCIVFDRDSEIVDKEDLSLLKECGYYIIKYYNKNKIQIQHMKPWLSNISQGTVEIDSVFFNDCLNVIEDLILRSFCGETNLSYENETMKVVVEIESHWREHELTVYKKENEKNYKVAHAYRIESCRKLYKLFKTIVINDGSVGIKEYDEVTSDQMTYIDNICKKLKKPFYYNPLEQSFDEFARLSEQEYKKSTEKQINTIKLINEQLVFESKEKIEIDEMLTRQEASKIIHNYKDVFDRAKKRAEKEKKERMKRDAEIRKILYRESSGSFDSRDEWEFMAHMERF